MVHLIHLSHCSNICIISNKILSFSYAFIEHQISRRIKPFISKSLVYRNWFHSSILILQLQEFISWVYFLILSYFALHPSKVKISVVKAINFPNLQQKLFHSFNLHLDFNVLFSLKKMSFCKKMRKENFLEYFSFLYSHTYHNMPWRLS